MHDFSAIDTKSNTFLTEYLDAVKAQSYSGKGVGAQQLICI